MEKGKEERRRGPAGGRAGARERSLFPVYPFKPDCCDGRDMSSRRQAAASATHRERKKRKEQGEAEEGLIIAF